MKHKLLLLYTWIIRSVLFFLPDVPSVMRFRGYLYGLGMNSCGKNFQVPHDANIKGLEFMDIGNNCVIGNNVLFLGSGGTRLEDEVLIGPNTIIVSAGHGYKNGSFRFSDGLNYRKEEIVISFGSWVGANCTVYAGALLPKGSVLAANSFLNKKFMESRSIYAGSPACHIKKIHE